MNFDVIIANPPYQNTTVGTKTHPIWDKFVLKAFDHLNTNGYLLMVHPAGWRNVSGRFEPVRDLLYSKQMEYLEIHNEKDGRQTFGAATRYDWYCVKNAPHNGEKTLVRFEDGTEKSIKLDALPFIPNHSYNEIKKLLAKPGEETVELLFSRSAYGHDKQHTSKTKSKKFKYPVVYTVTVRDEPTFYWSNTNEKGHFGIPKLIWSNGARAGNFIDINGDYGVTEFAYGIVDSPSNLKYIKKAFDSEEFQYLIRAASTTVEGIPYKVVACLRKDFWKDFV